MNGDVWFEKYRDNPITEKFLEMFGGYFQITPDSDWLYYEDNDYKPFRLPYTETIIWDMISRSVREKKNLLIL